MPVPPREPRNVIVIGGPIRPADIPCLCEHLRRLPPADLGEDPVVCDVAAVAPADLCAVDGLARMTLTAHRSGRGLALRDASPDLRGLLELTGLAQVVGEPGCLPED